MGSPPSPPNRRHGLPRRSSMLLLRPWPGFQRTGQTFPPKRSVTRVVVAVGVFVAGGLVVGGRSPSPTGAVGLTVALVGEQHLAGVEVAVAVVAQLVQALVAELVAAHLVARRRTGPRRTGWSGSPPWSAGREAARWSGHGPVVAGVVSPVSSRCRRVLVGGRQAAQSRRARRRPAPPGTRAARRR